MENACKSVFDDIINPKLSKEKEKSIENDNSENAMKPYLNLQNIDNIYSEPLRNIETIKVLIEIALLNADFQTAQKWITV